MNKKITISWKATAPLGVVFLIVGLFFVPVLLGFLVLAPAGLIFIALAVIDLFKKNQLISTGDDQLVKSPPAIHNPWLILGLMILILTAITASAIAVYKQNKKEAADILSTIPLSPSVEWRIFQSQEFGFEISYPKEIYSPLCKTFKEVEVTEEIRENYGIINIGTKFNCPKQDPNYFQGFILYTSNKVATEVEAQSFIKEVLGDDCKISDWSGEDFSIDPDFSEGASFEEQWEACGFLRAKYRLNYSPEKQTVVLWSITQEPQFYYSDTEWYLEEISDTFQFIGL